MIGPFCLPVRRRAFARTHWTYDPDRSSRSLESIYPTGGLEVHGDSPSFWERMGTRLARRLQRASRALHNPVFGSMTYALLAFGPQRWACSPMALSVLGIRTGAREGGTSLRVPGRGGTFQIAHPVATRGPECLRELVGYHWLDVAVLDEYDACTFLDQGMTVVDIGANTGVFSLLASRLVGQHGRVIAVEPEPRNYACLVENVTFNALANVFPIQCALGAGRGTLSLSLSDETSGQHSAVMPRGDKHIEVAMTTLDSLCTEHGIDRLDFLKIDVEGYEPQVLDGGRDCIARFRPTIAVAAYHFPEHEELLPAIIRDIDSGYEARCTRMAPGLELKCFAEHVSRKA